MRRPLAALGRLKPGEMNKTEAAYADHLRSRVAAGEVIWWEFEGVKLKLANACFLSIDFAVLLADRSFELHDVKGSRSIFSDDARVKMKVAADKFPLRIVACYPRAKRDGGGWDIEEF